MHISTYIKNIAVAFIAIFALLVTSLFPVVSQAQESTITPLGSLVDGDVVKTANHHDVYIVKIVGAGTSNVKRFKRLIINPDIFESYGHLEWGNIKTVTQATLNAFTLSDLVMEVNEDGTPVDGNIYRLYATESDAGIRSHLQFTPAQFEAASLDWDSVFYVNHIEGGEEFYEAAAPIVTETHLITHSHLPTGTTFAVAPAPLGSSGEVAIASVPEPQTPTPPPTATPPTQPTPPTLPVPPADDTTSDAGSTVVGSSGAGFVSALIDDDLDAPSNFRSSNNGITSSILSWRRVSGATGYEIQWCSASCPSRGNWSSKYTITNSSTTRHTIQGLAPYTTYKVRIRSFKSQDDVSKWRSSIITNLGQGFDISLYIVGEDTQKFYKVHPSTGAGTQLDGVVPAYINLRTWIDYTFRPDLSGGRAVSGQPDEIRPPHYNGIVRSSFQRYDTTSGGFGIVDDYGTQDLDYPAGLAVAPDGSFFMVGVTYSYEGYLYRLDPVTYYATKYGTQEDGLGDQEYSFGALAFSPDGVLYGVGGNGYLYKFVATHYHPTRGLREECNIGGRSDDPDRCSPQHNLSVEIERINSWSEYFIDGKGTTKGFVDVPVTQNPIAPHYHTVETNPTGLAFVGDQLYMVGENTKRLYTINKETGQGFPVSAIKEFGQNIEYPRSLTAVGNTLYMGVTPFRDSPTYTSLYTVDPTTGLATPVPMVPKFGVGESQPGGLTAVITPLAPTNVVGVPASTTSISLSWTAPPKATEYEIQYCEVRNSQCGQWSDGVTTSRTSHTITGLEADKTYRVRVGNKKSGYSIGWKLTPNIKTYTPIVEIPSYAVASTLDRLYTINLETGAAQRVGSATQFGVNESVPTGLALNPLNDTLYMIGSANDKLYTLNRETGVATAVDGSTTQFGVSEGAPTGLAFSPDGTLYMAGDDGDRLYTLNTTTGVATAVDGSTTQFGASEATPQSIAFIGDQLYMVGDTRKLYTLNTTTGVATAVDSNVNDFGQSSTVYPLGLTSVGETLYMTAINSLTSPVPSLYSVDPATGIATKIDIPSRFGVSETIVNDLAGEVKYATPPSFTQTIDSTKNSITISWDSVTDAETYAIRYCVASSCTWSEPQTTTDTIHTLTGLTASTSYKIGIGVDRQSEGYDIKWTERTASTSPDPALFNLRTTDIQNDNIELTWDDVSSGGEYVAQYCVAQSNSECDYAGWIRKDPQVNVRSVVIDQLTPNTNYRIRVGEAPTATSDTRVARYWSEPLVVQTLTNPISFSFAEGVHDTSITINWQPASGATGYKVQHCEVGSCGSWTDSAILPTSDISYTISSGITLGETYRVRIGKQVQGGTIEWSAYKALTTWDVAYAFSLDRYADPVQNSVGLAVILHTTSGAPQRDYTSRVEYCEIADISVSIDCAGPWLHAGDVPPTRHLFPVQYLNAETYYKVRVGKIRSDGLIYWIQQKTISTPERPHSQPIQKVTGRRISLVTTTSIILTWNAQSYAIYDVHYCAASDCPSWTELTASSHYITVDGLQPNTEYRFRIRARRSVVREGQAQDLTVGAWRSSTFNVTTSPTQ